MFGFCFSHFGLCCIRDKYSICRRFQKDWTCILLHRESRFSFVPNALCSGSDASGRHFKKMIRRQYFKISGIGRQRTKRLRNESAPQSRHEMLIDVHCLLIIANVLCFSRNIGCRKSLAFSKRPLTHTIQFISMNRLRFFNLLLDNNSFPADSRSMSLKKCRLYVRLWQKTRERCNSCVSSELWSSCRFCCALFIKREQHAVDLINFMYFELRVSRS